MTVEDRQVSRVVERVKTARPVLRMAWRQVWRRPLQSAFLVVGVMIGVAMVVAVDLANGSAQRAFELGAESVAGRTTHQIAGGPSGLDESLYVRLRRDLGYRLSAPAVEEYVTVEELDAQPMRLLAIDPFAEGPFRSYLGGRQWRPSPDYLSELMVRPNSVLLERNRSRTLWLGLLATRCRRAPAANAARHRGAVGTERRPQPPGAGFAVDRGHRHRAGSPRQDRQDRPHRPDRGGRRRGAVDLARSRRSCRRARIVPRPPRRG